MIRKAKEKAASRKISVSPGSTSTPAPEQDTESSITLVRQNYVPAPPPFLDSYYSTAPTIDEKATSFFFANHIINLDRRSGNSAGYAIGDNLFKVYESCRISYTSERRSCS